MLVNRHFRGLCCDVQFSLTRLRTWSTVRFASHFVNLFGTFLTSGIKDLCYYTSSSVDNPFPRINIPRTASFFANHMPGLTNLVFWSVVNPMFWFGDMSNGELREHMLLINKLQRSKMLALTAGVTDQHPALKNAVCSAVSSSSSLSIGEMKGLCVVCNVLYIRIMSKEKKQDKASVRRGFKPSFVIDRDD